MYRENDKCWGPLDIEPDPFDCKHCVECEKLIAPVDRMLRGRVCMECRTLKRDKEYFEKPKKRVHEPEPVMRKD